MKRVHQRYKIMLSSLAMIFSFSLVIGVWICTNAEFKYIHVVFQESIIENTQSSMLHLKIESDEAVEKITKIVLPNQEEIVDSNTASYIAKENREYTFLIHYTVLLPKMEIVANEGNSQQAITEKNTIEKVEEVSYVVKDLPSDANMSTGLESVLPFSSSNDIEIVSVFPDARFRAWVNSNVDTDKNGYLSLQEMTNVINIDINRENTTNKIASLQGIECFTELETLNCSYNEINTLDLKNNKKLKELDCSQNPITELDLTANTDLEIFNYNNINGQATLQTLDVSQCTKLKRLFCQKTKITNLDISQLSLLTDFLCTNAPLKNIDVTNNLLIENIWVFGTDIESIDVSKCLELTAFLAESSNLKSLDVSKNKKLKILQVGGYLTLPKNDQIQSIDLSNNTELQTLYINCTNIKELDISKNTKLDSLSIIQTPLQNLDLSKNEDIFSLLIESTELASLDVSNHTSLSSMIIKQCKNLSNLNLQGATGLSMLDCSQNALTTIHVSSNNNLASLLCKDQKIVVPMIKGEKGWKSKATYSFLANAIITTPSAITYDSVTQTFESNIVDSSAIAPYQSTVQYGSKTTSLNGNISFLFLNDEFVEVNDIVKFPTSIHKGTECILDATVVPDNATHKDILWSIVDAGTTGAVITNGKIKATSLGTIKVKATIKDGVAIGTDFTKEVTILAIDTLISTHTVKFVMNGNTIPSFLPNQIITHGDKINKPVSPVKVGYTFVGWYSDKSMIEPWDFAKDIVTSNITLYAKWNSNQYTVTFDGNGGTSPTSVIKNYNTPINTLPVSSRDGYVFAGWYDAKTGGNKITSTTKVVKNVTYYAHWTALQYNIFYQLDGGINTSLNPSKYTIEDTIYLDTPSKAGYSFIGWYDSNTEGNKVTSIAKGSTGNKTYYARWQKSKGGISGEVVIEGGSGENGNAKPGDYLTVNTEQIEPKDGTINIVWKDKDGNIVAIGPEYIVQDGDAGIYVEVTVDGYEGRIKSNILEVEKVEENNNTISSSKDDSSYNNENNATLSDKKDNNGTSPTGDITKIDSISVLLLVSFIAILWLYGKNRFINVKK